MTLLAVALTLFPFQADDIGRATYYRSGLMAEVAETRGMSLDGFVDGVALNDCSNLEKTVWLEFEGIPVPLGPMKSVDCAQPKHAVIREQQGYVVEVSAALAKRVGFYGIGPWPVRVLFEMDFGAIQ